MDMFEMLNHKQRAMADFYECLAEFRELTKGVAGLNSVKKFNNLKEFHAHHAVRHPSNPKYVKKTDREYGKSGIPSKIPFKRQENPKEWMKQYGWFRHHPEATVYDPQAQKPKKEAKKEAKKEPKKKQKRVRKSFSEISKKIPFKRSENPKEYDKQYSWFNINPEATVYEPRVYRGHGDLNRNPLITVTREEDPVEYQRQYLWLRLHIHENPDKIPPRSISHHTKVKS
jgi:hypothetical protein